MSNLVRYASRGNLCFDAFAGQSVAILFMWRRKTMGVGHQSQKGLLCSRFLLAFGFTFSFSADTEACLQICAVFMLCLLHLRMPGLSYDFDYDFSLLAGSDRLLIPFGGRIDSWPCFLRSLCFTTQALITNRRAR
jgi:hypothetical protein